LPFLKKFINFKIPFQTSSSQHNVLNLTGFPELHTFFKLLNQEINKATNFFEQTEEILLLREQRVRNGVKIMKKYNCKSSDAYRKSKVALSVICFYKDLMALETFAIATYCCIMKILKKIDKKTGLQVGFSFMQVMVRNANFTEYPRTKKMMQATRAIYEEVIDTISSTENHSLQSDKIFFVDALSRLCTKKSEALKYPAINNTILEESTRDEYDETASSALSLRSKVFCFGLSVSDDTRNDAVSHHSALSLFGVATRLDFDNME
jgi:hypothetical protein